MFLRGSRLNDPQHIDRYRLPLPRVSLYDRLASVQPANLPYKITDDLRIGFSFLPFIGCRDHVSGFEYRSCPVAACLLHLRLKTHITVLPIQTTLLKIWSNVG